MKALQQEQQHAYTQVLLPSIPKVPCLTTKDEQHYLYWLAKEIVQDKGSIVELGTWFGASAAYIAAGLRDGNHTSKLYCFDRFISTNSDTNVLGNQYIPYNNLHSNANTQPLVEEFIRNQYPSSYCIKTEMNQMKWDLGPIELLHVDAPKRWADIMHILKVLMPSLVPGQSVVVLQDFCVPRAYPLPLIFGALSDSFRLAHIPTQHGTTAVFEYYKECALTNLNIFDWKFDRVMKTWESTVQHFSLEQRNLLTIGLAFYFYDADERDVAQELLSQVQ